MKKLIIQFQCFVKSEKMRVTKMRCSINFHGELIFIISFKNIRQCEHCVCVRWKMLRFKMDLPDEFQFKTKAYMWMAYKIPRNFSYLLVHDGKRNEPHEHL